MKEELKAILKNPNDQLIAIDIDGVLCDGIPWEKTDPVPSLAMINKIEKWYKQGAHIIIYTARLNEYFSSTAAWLTKHNVPYHGLCMGKKPGADVYIDDKALNINDIN